MYKNNTHLPWKHKTDDSHGYPNTVDVGRIFYSVNNINIDYGSTLTEDAYFQRGLYLFVD